MGEILKTRECQISACVVLIFISHAGTGQLKTSILALTLLFCDLPFLSKTMFKSQYFSISYLSF